MNRTTKWILGIVGGLVLLCGFAFVVWQAAMFYSQPQVQTALDAYESQPARSDGLPVNDLEQTVDSPAVAETKCPKNIPAGETVFVPAGCVVLGDVEYAGNILYDVGGSDQATAAMVTGDGASFFAEWGAGVEPMPSFQNYSSMVNYYASDEMETGCGDSNPCSEVRLVIVEYGTIVYDEVQD